MHEPTIAAELIELVQREIARAGHPGAAVTKIVVRVGILRGIAVENLSFAFDALKNGTPLCKAELTLERGVVEGTCQCCGFPFMPSEPIFLCEACGSGNLDVQGGNELDLVEIILEEND